MATEKTLTTTSDIHPSDITKRAITHDGRLLFSSCELVEDLGGDECERCALNDQCNCNINPLCLNLFGDAYNKRFEEKMQQ